MIVAEGFGNTAQACRALNLGRSTYYLTCQKGEVSHLLEQEIISKSKDHPRYAYRRITAMVRRDGYLVNPKRTQRVRRIEGLQVKKKQRKMRWFGESTAQLHRATRPGEVWSWDFVTDMTRSGYRFRMLTLIDEYTCQCLAIYPAWSIRANVSLMWPAILWRTTGDLRILEVTMARSL